MYTASVNRSRQNSGIQREPRIVHFLQDIWRIVFYLFFLTADISLFISLPVINPPWLDLAGRIVGCLLTHVLLVFLLGELIPKPPEGSLRVSRERKYLLWVISRSFSDVVTSALFVFPFRALHLTRYIYFRALGAKLAYDSTIDPSVNIQTPRLLAVDAGAQLEAGVKVENVVHAMGRVKISPVTISEGALVGAHVVLMPGATLGPNARVGPGAYIGPETCIGVGAKVGEGAILAAGVDLGSYVRIGAGCVIAEGVSIAENARVRTGSIIPPSTRIRAGEIWQGVPARPVFRDARHPEDSEEF